jgi:nucleoside phosphorylase
VCALGEEFTAVAAALNKDFRRDCGTDFGKVKSDTNTYTTGRLANHDVVIVYLPNTGKGSAFNASASILISYPNIKLALVVRVCAAALKDQKSEDIILGDILISTHVVKANHARYLDNGIQTY